jgi:hypothetical protein
MYSPIARNRSTHLGYSCFAQHWLDDGAPTGLPGDALWANQLPKNCPQRQHWEIASRENWEKKLLVRACEIVPGGRLIIHIHSSKNCGSLSENFAATLQKAKHEMLANKELNIEQANAMYIPQYCKSPSEIFNTLCNIQAVSSLWEIEEAHYSRLDSEKFFNQSNTKKQIKFLRGFLDSTLATSLNKNQLARFWDYVNKLADNNTTALSSNGMSTFICLKRLP